MQAKAPDPENEPPSMLWGLDPIFSAFARLYVRDILDMEESTQVPGNFHDLLQTMRFLCVLYYNRQTNNKQQDNLPEEHFYFQPCNFIYLVVF